jgi:hypothetical protein
MREPSGRICLVIRHVIGIHRDAVAAIDRSAIHEQIPATVGPNLTQCEYRKLDSAILVMKTAKDRL